MVVGDHRVVSYRKAVAEAMSADQLSRPLLVRQIYQRQDKDERSWSITDGRRKDGSRYSPRVGAGVGGGEGRVPRPGLTRHRLTQSWSQSSFPPRLRSANAVLPSLLEHQRPCPPRQASPSQKSSPPCSPAQSSHRTSDSSRSPSAMVAHSLLPLPLTTRLILLCTRISRPRRDHPTLGNP